MRHTYEFPFNVFLRDAIKLKRYDNVFKNQHITNLLQIVATVANGICDYTNLIFITKNLYRPDQCLGPIGKRLTTLTTINKKLAEISDNYNNALKISDIYKRSVRFEKNNKKIRPALLPTSVIIDNSSYSVMSFGYWFNSKDWEKDRLKLYKNYYDNFLKRSKKKTIEA